MSRQPVDISIDSRRQMLSDRRHFKPGDRVFRPTRKPPAKPWRTSITWKPKIRPVGSPFVMLVAGFGTMILLGTILLMLPVASRSGEWTSLIDALFTSTSAVCVTGLVVVDTLDYWTFFGQAVILVLIQLGGFGFMSSATIFLLALGRRIGLRERLLIRESVGITELGGLLRIVQGMAFFTIAAELVGALIFFTRFTSEYSPATAVWKSVFQSISAFNNAGFDIFGGFRSITEYANDPLVVLTTAVLVILGGISFLVLRDIAINRSIKKLSVDTKLVIIVTVVLLALGMIVILTTEFGNTGTLAGMSFPQKILNSLFQSVTSRTAGFSSFTTANLTDYALFFTMLLMFVGGASGSTAGGIKVNTFGMLTTTIWDSIRGQEYPGIFHREYTSRQIYRSLAVIALALGVVTVMMFLLSIVEDFQFIKVLFETVSAFGTVGLSTGITPDLSIFGRILITITMFIGRLGPLTLTLALIARQQPTVFRYPKEIIRIG